MAQFPTTDIFYRAANEKSIPQLANIRARNSGTEEHWNQRIAGYINGTHNPQQSLEVRIIYAAFQNENIVGFIAGHLSRRFGCDGELQWIDVVEERRRQGIGSTLVRCLATWFTTQNAYKICVDPGNDNTRKFYESTGAVELNQHWMYWEDISAIL